MALTNSTLSAAIEAALDSRVANESSDAALRSMCGADAAAVLDAVRAAAGGTTYSLLHVHGGLLRALLNAGVCHNARQKELYSALESDTLAQAVIAAVAKVAAAAGNGHAANEQDAIVIGVAWDLLSLCGPAVSPVVQQWVAATCAHSEIAAALAARKLATGGMKRIGGQVDLRASPSLVAALADASVAKHALVRKATQHAAAEAAPPQPSPAAVAPVPVAAAPPAVAAVEAAAAPARAASQPSSNKDVPKLSPEDRIAATHARLEALGVAYTTTRHAAANNVEELLAALAIVGPAGTRCKNLYVKAKKEKAANDSRTWLVVAAHDTKVGGSADALSAALRRSSRCSLNHTAPVSSSPAALTSRRWISSTSRSALATGRS